MKHIASTQMKTVILAAALTLSGCAMTPTQQKWAAVGASVVIVGAIAAHRADHGNGSAAPITASSKGDSFCSGYHYCGQPVGK